MVNLFYSHADWSKCWDYGIEGRCLPQSQRPANSPSRKERLSWPEAGRDNLSLSGLASGQQS